MFMNAIVTIFSSELTDKQYLRSQLEQLCHDSQKVGNAFIFSPSTGKLLEFLSILKFNKVAYGTHFDTKAVIMEAK